MKKRGYLRKIVNILLIGALMCCTVMTSFAKDTNRNGHARVLLISSYDYDWESVPKQLQGFRSEIEEDVGVDYVFMNTKTFSFQNVENNIYQRIQNNIKYVGNYDLIVLCDDDALDFALKYQNQLFKGIPMLFTGINAEEKAKSAAKDPLITGVVESFPMEETIAFAKNVCPKATQIVAIVDDSETANGSLQQFYDSKEIFPELDFQKLDCTQMTDEQVSEKISSYGQDTILLYIIMDHNADGRDISVQNAVKIITKHAKVPIFKMDEIGIGEGLLGGNVISFEEMGKLTGKLAQEILDGTPAETIEVVTIPYHTMIDEVIMRQYHINKNLIPKDAIIINHAPTFWERYHKILIPTGVVITFLVCSLIFATENNRRKRKYIEDLREKDIMLNSLVKNIPGGIAIYKMSKKIETIFFSEGIPKLSGRTREEYEKCIQGEAFVNTVYEEDLNNVKESIFHAVQKKEKFDITYRLKHKDGSLVWVQLSAVPIRMENKVPVYYAIYTALPEEAILYRDIITESPTGVYVCDTENYNMLYANKKVIEDMKDANYSGRKCYEYIYHKQQPCKDCPIRNLQSDQFTYREYDVNGRHLHIKSKIFDFHGVRAHIDYVTDGTVEYQQQKKKEADYQTQIELMSRMSKGCLGRYHINITKDYIEDGYGENVLKKIGIEKKQTIIHALMSAKKHIPNEEEFVSYLQLFERKNLLTCFEKGENTVSMEHSMKLKNGAIHQCKTTVVMVQNPMNDDIEGNWYVEDVHTARIRKALTEKSMQINSKMLICIDIINDTYVVFSSSNTSNPIYQKYTNISFRKYLIDHYVGEALNQYLEKCKLENIQKELENKEIYSFSVPVKLDGENHYIQATFAYIEKETGLIALVISDITELYNLQQEQQNKLTQALKKAEAANEAKTKFLSTMSHDMRTPMNGILGLSYIMENQTDIEGIKKDIPKLRESGDYLLRLINDVLDVNKIVAQKMELHPKPCDTKKMFQIIMEMINPQIEKKSITFHFDQANIQWTYSLIDEQRVKQIFVNLLSNAVKFTPDKGKIDFIMELVSENDVEKCYCFHVKDNGIGISEDILPRIFEPFVQENRLEESLAGTGLGLPIVKELVGNMGGRIEVKSKLNEGTEFILYLNFPICKQTEKKDEMKAVEFPANLKILLCEDHPLNAKIAMKLLEKQGAEVTWRENGQLGVETFDKSQKDYFDVVLMDIRMPVMDGLEATKAIRNLQRPDAKAIPIIAMTANAYDEDIQKSYAAGMNAHLAKPVQPAKMMSTITEFVTKRWKDEESRKIS